MPRPLDCGPALSGRRIDMVNVSVEPAVGHIHSGFKPFVWNTSRNVSQEDNDQGFAPSATSRMRRLDKLMSLWSFCVIRPQCMSRDLTSAIDAEIISFWHLDF